MVVLARTQIHPEVQWRLNSLLLSRGYSAYQLVFGCNLADLIGWGDNADDLLLAQDCSLSILFVQQWELRVMAQEAAMEEVAGCELRRSLAFTKQFCGCAGGRFRLAS